MTKLINVKTYKSSDQPVESDRNDLGEWVGAIEEPDNSSEEISKRKSVQTMGMKLQKIKEALNISIQDRALRQHLAFYNFNEERFLEGSNLVGKVNAIILELLNIRAEKLNATRHAQLKRKHAYDTFVRFRKIGRIAFENNPEMRAMIPLNKPISKTYAIWLIQAKTFYDTVLNYREAIEGYARYNVTLEQLEEGRRQVLEAEKVVTQSVEITARAQTITSTKNRLYRELLDWWSEFKTILRIVLKKYPALLEKSEIVVLKRTGAKKTATRSYQLNRSAADVGLNDLNSSLKKPEIPGIVLVKPYNIEYDDGKISLENTTS